MENIFYIVSIIFMLLVFSMLLGTVFALWVIKNKVTTAQREVKRIVKGLKHIQIGKKYITEDADVVLANIAGTKKQRPKK